MRKMVEKVSDLHHFQCRSSLGLDTKFDQHISKIAACRLNTRKQTNRPTDKITWVPLYPSEHCIRPGKLNVLLYHKWCISKNVITKCGHERLRECKEYVLRAQKIACGHTQEPKKPQKFQLRKVDQIIDFNSEQIEITFLITISPK